MQKLCLFALAIFCMGCEAKHFATRCGLVHELRRQGFPEDKMRDWVCLIEKESSRRTDKTRINKDFSRDHGLFQINDKYWCSNTSTPGKGCNVTCAELVTDDITKASECAKNIYQRVRFAAWYGYNRCLSHARPDVRNC